MRRPFLMDVRIEHGGKAGLLGTGTAIYRRR